MTWLACGAEDLSERSGRDGSYSLWSEAFGEGFHSGRGALREARETFLNPSELARFADGRPLRLVEVCVGTGSNLAVLLEACAALGVSLEWRGLEIDPRPLERALAAPAFRRCWQPATLSTLERLLHEGGWRAEGHGSRQAESEGRILWGDARRSLPPLLRSWRGSVDRIWHDAFSPQRCPQLWTKEWLTQAVALLNGEGGWISYCSAAAVRETLRLAGLHLVALNSHQPHDPAQAAWSGGTMATWQPPPPSSHWRALTAMEREHLASTAGEPYRDPSGEASAASILACRQQAQREALARGAREASSAWRQRWGLQRRPLLRADSP